MSTEENKAVVRRVFEEWNKGKRAAIATVDELFAPDFVFHGTGVFPDIDLADLKQFYSALWTPFPNVHFTIEDQIAEGDKVVTRFTFRGTHQGEFMGIPPTGKQVRFTGIEINRIKDGKPVEVWANRDELGLLRQLGVIPQMAQADA
jgi:steroid delta-isomerase-like uncharacterized protein